MSPSRNPLRKLRELIIARRLEHELTKTRIFELYLNEIEWGDGIYGAEAAARSYFGISAAAVDPDQAALMAGAIVNPRDLNVTHPSGRLRNREHIIRARMGNVTPPPVLATPTETMPAPGSLPEAAPPEPVPGPSAEPSEHAPPAPAEPTPEPTQTAPEPQPANPPVPQPFPGAGRP